MVQHCFIWCVYNVYVYTDAQG
uniref:Uncharacterized protein n=1 Tax=Anguilla anguilla TaxID=7936 RepID=A0A0E9V731_ANGAN